MRNVAFAQLIMHLKRKHPSLPPDHLELPIFQTFVGSSAYFTKALQSQFAPDTPTLPSSSPLLHSLSVALAEIKREEGEEGTKLVYIALPVLSSGAPSLPTAPLFPVGTSCRCFGGPQVWS